MCLLIRPFHSVALRLQTECTCRSLSQVWFQTSSLLSFWLQVLWHCPLALEHHVPDSQRCGGNGGGRNTAVHQRRLVSLHVAAVEGVISVCGGIKKALPVCTIYHKCMSRINCVRYLFCLLLSCSKNWIDSNRRSPVSSLIFLFLGQQICDETTPAASFSVPGFRMIEGKCLFINQGLQSWVREKKTFSKTHSESEHPTIKLNTFWTGCSRTPLCNMWLRRWRGSWVMSWKSGIYIRFEMAARYD